MIQKQGNNYSELLKSIEKIANQKSAAKPSFNDQILEVLKGAKKPSLQEIIADMGRGKNIHRTAQYDSPMGGPMAKPLDAPMDDLGGDPGAPGGIGGDLNEVEDISGGGLEDDLGGVPGEGGIPGEEGGGDIESAARNLAQALIDLQGPEVAKQTLEEVTGGGLGEPGLDEGLGEPGLDGLGEEGLDDGLGEGEVPFEDPGLEEAEAEPMQSMQPMKPMQQPGAPAQMPGLV